MTDELGAPLIKPAKKKFSFPKLSLPKLSKPKRFPFGRLFFGLSFLLILGMVSRVALIDDPFGGRPIAEVSISSSADTNQVIQDVAPQSEAAPEQPQVDTNGPGPLIVTLGEDAEAISQSERSGDALTLHGLTELGVLPELTEETQNGPIPHVASDGRTPFSAYSRASISPATSGSKPLVALIVTGLGLNESATLEAIAKLPDNVTLAFAPYSRTLHRTTAEARNEGHELLLQIPLEPFDYPENDPGPQTLLTGQSPRTNFDRLYWLMARMGGYFGVMNHLGARFTASAADLEPIMEEIGTRGLGYIDDGSSNRSLTSQMARRNRVPFARADAQIDANPSRAAIFEALDELVAKARAKGSAVGVVSALPVSIQAVSEWAAKLADDNVALVPVSALMGGEQ